MTHLTRSSINKLTGIASFWLFCLTVSAQVSGYQGKRSSIEYANYFFPAYYNPNANGKSGLLKLNDRNSLSFDYVITKHYSLGCSFEFFKTKYKYPIIYDYNEEINTNVLGDISSTLFGIHYKHFYTFLAPLGSYYRVDVCYIRFKTGFNREEIIKSQNYSNANLIMDIKNDKYYNGLLVGVTYGYQRVYYDRLIVGYGFQIALNTLNISLAELDQNAIDLSKDNYLKLTGQSRLTHHYFLNFFLGLGVLLF
jgi:hypothetical protein